MVWLEGETLSPAPGWGHGDLAAKCGLDFASVESDQSPGLSRQQRWCPPVPCAVFIAKLLSRRGGTGPGPPGYLLLYIVYVCDI